MVNDYAAAKDFLQPFGQLCSKGNLGHQQKGLSSLLHHIVDEMHVNFGLAARGHAVQQRDVVVDERLVDVAEGRLLGLRQLRQLTLLLSPETEARHLLLVHLDKAFFGKGLQYGRRAAALLEQGRAADCLGFAGDGGKLAEGHQRLQHLLLAPRAVHGLEGPAHGFVVATGDKQTHEGLGLGAKTFDKLLADDYRAFFHHPAHAGREAFDAGLLLKLGDRQASLAFEGLPYRQLLVGEDGRRLVGLHVGIDLDI